jgi:hypothetical protein
MLRRAVRNSPFLSSVSPAGMTALETAAYIAIFAMCVHFLYYRQQCRWHWQAFAKPGACPRCGFTRGTTATLRVAFGVAIFAISALMFYGMWSLIPQVMASL